MSHIIDNIYLGAVNIARDPKFIKDNKIQVILICAKGLKQTFNKIIYHQIDIADNPCTLIIKYFIQCLQFLHQHKQQNILVHCLGGKSRSATIVIMYVMFSKQLSFQQAFQLVKQQHPKTDPNPGFIKQLKAFDKVLQLYGHPKQIDFNLITLIMDKNDIVGQIQCKLDKIQFISSTIDDND